MKIGPAAAMLHEQACCCRATYALCYGVYLCQNTVDPTLTKVNTDVLPFLQGAFVKNK